MPAYLFQEPDVLRRARLVAFFAAFAAFCGVPLVAFQFLFGNMETVWLPVFGTLGAVSSIVALRWSRSVVLGAHFFLAVCGAGLTAMTLVRGGFGEPAALSTAIVPLIALAIGGRRVGEIWLGLIVVDLIIIAFIQRYLGLTRLLPADPVTNYVFSHIVFVAATYTLMSVHVRLRESAAEERRLAEAALLAAEVARQASETESRLLRSSRMAELGTLAAGVAHEINNPLSSIQGNISFLQDVGASIGGAEQAEILDDVQESCARIAQIVRDISTFSRMSPEDAVEAVSLEDVFRASLRLMNNQLRHRAKIQEAFAANVPAAKGDASRLQQVVVNLLSNAIQAIDEERSDGEIIVRTRRGEEGEVIAEVEDNGAGIPQKLRQRVLEPFFTTKAVGEGTGLGLSICFGIVSKLGGRIGIDSDEGRGTRVSVVLPAAEVPAVAPEAKPVSNNDEARVPRLRILVVDDEPAVGKAMRRLLRAHEVTVVEGGREALALLDEGEEIDLILCDLMMPGMSGMELCAEVEARRPDLADRIIIVTGGTFTEAARTFLREGEHLCVDKPVSLERLEEAIAACLER
ncbi:MAG: hypothetical protein CSB49_07275 [Proteobacteria bacterium]|nr:MAG: hypothetical protein CSB49_07275 [Pseudomonadota bacterium]